MARYGYCFTLNNYTPAQELALKGAVGQCGIQYIIFGREVGEENGTPHLQGYLQSNQKNKERFHKKFDIYVVPQKAANPIDAAVYCKKQGDFYEAGEFDPTVKGLNAKKPGARTDLESVKEAIERGESYDEICLTHFSEAAKYGRFIKERINAQAMSTELNLLRKEYENASLKPWQQALLDVVEENPHPRRIHWLWEARGNVGKSWMAKYLVTMKNACLLKPMKYTDMAHMYCQESSSNIVVFDLSRTVAPKEDGKDFLHSVYQMAEDIKTGMVRSGKYEGLKVTKRDTGTHVIFFANWEPDMTKWSEDRYNVIPL